jgi:PAS domain S-box-containing protein
VPSDALNDVETRLQLLGRATHDAIWDWDLIHDETVWNEALLFLFGHMGGEVRTAANWWKEKIHPDDRERVVQSIEAVIRSRTRSSWMQEYRFRRADGSYADVLDRGYVMRNAKGEAVRMVGAMQDHTDRKKVEEALRLRDRALEAIGQGVVITDYRQPDNPIIYVNSGFEVLTGYQEQEVLGRNCRFLQGKETDQQQVREIGNALRAGRAHRRSLLNYRKDGTAFVNELTLSPIRDRKGTITHYVGVQSDVTRRTEVEEQLRQAQKMEALGQLTGGIAHDFNNLLTVILGNSELLVDQPNDAELVASLSRQIMEAAERSSDLTQKLLAFGRRQSLKPQRLNVSGVVTSMVPLLRRTIGAHIELRTELHEGEHTALSDCTLLERYSNGPRLQLDWRGGCPPVMME